jgi:hypothetical protein
MTTAAARGMQTNPVHDELRAICLERWYHTPRTRAKVQRAVQYVLEAVTTGADVETYAQIKYGFWYKGYFFTPAGALKGIRAGSMWTLPPLRVVSSRRVICVLCPSVPCCRIGRWGDYRSARNRSVRSSCGRGARSSPSSKERDPC